MTYSYDHRSAAARRPKVKLPASIQAPSGLEKSLSPYLNTSGSTLYKPHYPAEKINKDLRDERHGVSIPFPGAYRGQAAIQVKITGDLYGDSGEVAVDLYAYVVANNTSTNIPIKGLKWFLVWEPDSDEKGYFWVARVDSSKPNLKGLLEKTKEYFSKGRA